MRIEIELSGVCNLRCVMCGQSKEYNAKIMTMDDLEKFRDMFNRAEEVTLHGYGEPLVSPYFFKVFEMVPEKTPISFLSNGHRLKPKILDGLEKIWHRIGRINFSIDSTDPEIYCS